MGRCVSTLVAPRHRDGLTETASTSAWHALPPDLGRSAPPSRGEPVAWHLARGFSYSSVKSAANAFLKRRFPARLPPLRVRCFTVCGHRRGLRSRSCFSERAARRRQRGHTGGGESRGSFSTLDGRRCAH